MVAKLCKLRAKIGKRFGIMAQGSDRLKGLYLTDSGSRDEDDILTWANSALSL